MVRSGTEAGTEAGTEPGAHPFHAGEVAAQRRAGVERGAGHVARSIRAGIPPVAAAFLAERRMLVLGAADGAGRLWASLLTGPPGFVRAGDEHTLLTAVRPPPGDPLAERLAAGPVPVGTIALEPATRRRMRANGIAEPDGPGLRVRTRQVFANCPKYIQRRDLVEWRPRRRQDSGGAAVTDRLDPGQLRRIATADTFFIATSGADGTADASHRGGSPGFVRALAPDRLSWPEYPGNNMLMTLGNLAQRPATGLLFPDWTTGTLLQLTGEARTDWDVERAARYPGAERVVDFRVTGVLETVEGSELRWGAPEFSPANPPVDPPVNAPVDLAAGQTR